MEGLMIGWYGALAGLALAIILILKKLNPVYALFLGAITGALIGGANLEETVSVLVSGTQSVIGTVLRVLAAGVLAGVMMESGAAETIAQAIVKKFGGSKAILALALATMLITAVGVFIPVAVLIVAPIALSVGNKMGISKLALLVALSGGGKAGNIISPNPNTIAAARGFELDLSHVMLAGLLPAVFGLAVTVIVASLLKKKGTMVSGDEAQYSENENNDYPPLGRAIVAPLVAIVLLMINPIGSLSGIELLSNMKVDALYILPIAGLIAASDLSTQVVALIEGSGIAGTFLAPISGILMAAATASTSTGVILATGSFGQAVLNMGTPPLAASVMVHTGATVIDSLPQGNYFHVTADSMKMSIKQRMGVVPYEAIVGGTMTIVATVVYGFLL
ncbi:High-affinity gluconate transporter [compost metagenome]